MSQSPTKMIFIVLSAGVDVDTMTLFCFGFFLVPLNNAPIVFEFGLEMSCVYWDLTLWVGGVCLWRLCLIFSFFG